MKILDTAQHLQTLLPPLTLCHRLLADGLALAVALGAWPRRAAQLYALAASQSHEHPRRMILNQYNGRRNPVLTHGVWQ
jgi:hypothetical protein